MARDRYAHQRNEEFKHICSTIAKLAEVVARPNSIDTYSDEKLRVIRNLAETGMAIIEDECGS